MMEDVEAIVKGLSKAQRAALVKFDDRVWSARELHFQTWGALFTKGLLEDVRAAGHRFFSWTELGLAVRTYLLSQTKE